METVPLDSKTFVLCLTGAGVSAESGLLTFRDANGLWEGHRVEEVATPEGFARDPRAVWRFYSARREAAAKVSPNAGHLALAELEQKLGDRFLLVTQNVDGLHARAGNQRIVEIHGNLRTTRCSRCDRQPFADLASYWEEPPHCTACETGLLRPHIVWFGESLFPGDWERIVRFARLAAQRGRLVFIAAGTSGTVYPAAGLVNEVRPLGADTWLINAEPAENTRAFKHFIQGRSAEILPRLWVDSGAATS